MYILIFGIFDPALPRAYAFWYVFGFVCISSVISGNALACSDLEFCIYKPCAYGSLFWLPELHMYGIATL